MEVIEQVKNILSKKVDVSALSGEDSLTAIGLDSLDLVEVAMDIEEQLGIEFTSEEIKTFRTLNDVVEAINKKSK